MNNKLRYCVTPLLTLAVFFYAFYYFPRVIQDHFNILVIASALTPCAVLLLTRVRLSVGVIQAITLQLIYTFYGAWYWEHRDAITDHYFSFENPLRLGVLTNIFIISLVLASIVRLLHAKLSRSPQA